jgi:uncharacterized protein YgiM (DUF1202 family)
MAKRWQELAVAARSLLCALVLVMLAGGQDARAGLEPGPGKAWLTIASRTDPNDAIALAQRYAGQFPTTVVFQSVNGYFGVTLGWASKSEGDPLLRALIAQGAIPADSYFTAGTRFIRAIWSANGAHSLDAYSLYAATRIDAVARSTEPAPAPPTGTPVSPRAVIVAGLDTAGDNFLSLRSGPGTGYREIVRMLPGTRGTVTAVDGKWLSVTLSNGTTGWAFGRYLRDAPAPAPAAPEMSNADIPTVGPEEPATGQAENPEAKDIAALPEEPKAVEELTPQKPIAEQRRVALVMGNSKYRNTTELPNPGNDAASISEKLQGLGFTVIKGLDGTKADMELAVREFVKVLPESDVALFFYAGHAMQVNGRNFLIPVDAKLEDSTAIDFETIDLQVILEFMNGDDRVSIALLDACRDNPLARRFERSAGAKRSAFIGRGLAAPATGSGEILIGFATAPGEVALDGTGTNSPFTTALLKHIDAKGLDVELMLKRVKRDVFEMTDREQEPWHNSALRQEFYFNPE